MPPSKKICALIILFILLIPLLSRVWGGSIRTVVKSNLIQKDDKLHVDYEIKNMGTDAIYHLTLTTFLARNTDHTDPLGHIGSGGFLHYGCEFDVSGILPGNYIMATRIDFTEQNGVAHRVHHFSPIRIKPQSIKNELIAVKIELQAPRFNRKSFWHPQGKFELTLKNNLSSPLETAVVFFLPDGTAMKEPEKNITLQAHEKRVEKIPLSLDSSVNADRTYHLVAWYEVDGIHYSQQIDGMIKVEEVPFYFQSFLILAAILFFGFLAIAIFQQRKNSIHMNK
jgi:hypothetical protein